MAGATPASPRSTDTAQHPAGSACRSSHTELPDPPSRPLSRSWVHSTPRVVLREGAGAAPAAAPSDWTGAPIWTAALQRRFPSARRAQHQTALVPASPGVKAALKCRTPQSHGSRSESPAPVKRAPARACLSRHFIRPRHLPAHCPQGKLTQGGRAQGVISDLPRRGNGKPEVLVREVTGDSR